MHALPLFALLAAAAPPPPPAPIHLGDTETIAFLGDSITEQNLWTSYLETFFVSRFPGKRLVFTNVGVGGNRVEDAIARFARDVEPVHPTVVFVALGMNDGRYVAPDPEIRRVYLDGERKIADLVAALGAREILVTPSAVNDRQAVYLAPYNDTLASLAQGLAALAAERKLPIIDVLGPSRQAMAALPRPEAFTTDGVHPTPVGHFAIAHAMLGRFDVPRAIPDVVVSPSAVRAARPVDVRGVQARTSGVAFDLTLPFIPFYVPREAEPALTVVPFADTYNGGKLRLDGWTGRRAVRVVVDGREVAVLAPDERARGVAFAALEDAPWAEQGRALWKQARARHAHHMDAWRTMEVDGTAFDRGLLTYAPLVAAERAYVREAGMHLRDLVQPQRHHVVVEPTAEIPIRALELSPTYPYDGSAESFARAHPPETAPEGVVWRPVPVRHRAVDLAEALDHPKQTVVYARLTLRASVACDVALALGSNDGLTVFVNGERVLARDVHRGVKLGDDEVVAHLRRGDNTLLFRVTQIELNHGLALQATVKGDAFVEPIAPARRKP